MRISYFLYSLLVSIWIFTDAPIQKLGQGVRIKNRNPSGLLKIKMKIFSFTKMWLEPIFLTGSLAVFKIAAKPLNFGACFLAAAGGEMGSNYF